MAEINPMGRLYNDMVKILDSIVIKYSYRADELESFEVRSLSDPYMLACKNQDTFYTYDDYSREEFLEVNDKLEDSDITSYMNDLRFTPISLQNKLLMNRRKYVKENYVEMNDYYRMLNGLPNIGEKDLIFYLPKEMCEKYHIPENIPIHEIIKLENGEFLISAIEQSGYIDTLIEENKEFPEAEYLQHLGKKRIPFDIARKAKNFSILYLDSFGLMDSIHREFVHLYEQVRSYFMTSIYIFDYRSVITNYDKFIAVSIFVMTFQQLSVKVLKNAADREFYDTRAIQLLYETYGLPFNEKIDELTQKQLAQNLNLLIQKKACDKVFLDVCDILNFNGIEIYNYYLMRTRLFDDKGRPVIKRKKQLDRWTGREEEVYDYESMYDVHFQRVSITEKDIHAALTDELNRVSYYDVVYYDPFWWEDDELKKEVWETAYNVQETKYLSLAIPYRLTEMIFQSVYLLRIIEDHDIDLKDVMIYLPRISDKDFSLVEVIMLMSAILAKKHHISGKIYVMPSQLLHILEVIDGEMEGGKDYKEVLAFNFEAFTIDNIQKTMAMIEKYLTVRKYRTADGHDVDLRDDGTQDSYAPTHLVSFTEDTHRLNNFKKWLLTLSNESFGFSNKQKVEAVNSLFSDIQSLYHFLSFWMTETQDIDEIYAIRKFYEAAFYAREIPNMFKMDIKKNKDFTYEDWLKENSPDLYEFIQDLTEDDLFDYMNHIIYCLSKYLDDIGDLYILNDGVSPVQELIIQLIDFFRSFTTDMLDFRSIMLIDWRMENMMKLVDDPYSVYKLIGVADDFTTMSYSDFIHTFLARFSVEDVMHFYTSKSICARVEAPGDKISFYDVINYIHKVLVPLPDKMTFEDIPEWEASHIKVLDSMRLRDDCRVIQLDEC